MDADQLGQIETAILSIYMPGIDKQHRRQLRKLCKEKGIKLFNEDLQESLKRLLASIIRHRETDYDKAVKVVGREKARFYVQHQIDAVLK